MNKIIIVSALVGVLFPSGDGPLVNAFVQWATWGRIRPTAASGAMHLARKYIVIGGNIDGIDPNQNEDTYNMSKKERRRREREAGASKTKKKTKKKFTINYDKLEEKVTRERTLMPREMSNIDKKLGTKSNLGVPSKRMKKKVEKKLSVKAARLKKQRTAGGTVNSNRETILSQSPEKQAIKIQTAKRGDKTVTMVQGMTMPMKDRKVLLKEMKGKFGGGGTMVEGVLELQGSHADKILDILRSKGYAGAKVVGGK